jgi:uncharacterized protein (DUF1684 family)
VGEKSEGIDPNQTAQASWEQWHASRLAYALDRFGPASLVNTAWLDTEPQAVDRVGGIWQLDDEAIVGRDILPGEISDVSGGATWNKATHELTLPPGASAIWGSIKLLSFKRFGDTALRVFDSSEPRHRGLKDLETYPFNPDWVVPARYSQPEKVSVEVEYVGGRKATSEVNATFDFELGGQERRLTAPQGHGSGHSLTFQDIGSKADGIGFRFLRIDPPPSGSDRTVIDFNRAFLPPCSFSPYYLCPMPLPGNSIDIVVEAGERTQVWEV